MTLAAADGVEDTYTNIVYVPYGQAASYGEMVECAGGSAHLALPAQRIRGIDWDFELQLPSCTSTQAIANADACVAACDAAWNDTVYGDPNDPTDGLQGEHLACVEQAKDAHSLVLIALVPTVAAGPYFMAAVGIALISLGRSVGECDEELEREVQVASDAYNACRAACLNQFLADLGNCAIWFRLNGKTVLYYHFQ